MELYVYLEIISEGAIKSFKTPVSIEVDKVENIRKAIIDYCIKKFTWCTVLSYQIYSISDSSLKNQKELYVKQPLKIICRKEKYKFEKGQSILIWSEDARVIE